VGLQAALLMQSDLFSIPMPDRYELRPYQSGALDDLDTLLTMGARAVLIVAPTGAGKTILAAELVRRHRERRILFLAPRRELIDQTSKKLAAIGIEHGIILAGDGRTNQYAQVQVASEDTLIARAVRKQKSYGEFDLIIKDEAHVGVTEARERLFALFPNAKIVGLTATPCRSDGKALGRVYEEMVIVSTVAELTRLGFLVPGRYYSVSEPDLKRVRVTAGEFNQKDVAAVMHKPKLVGDIVQHWLEHAAQRRTVVFATNIEHSMALAKEFISHGVSAEHVDANTPQSAREETFGNFQSGRTQVLTNCTLASIGFDLPELDCVVFARPTKSLGLYIQMLGRGLRPAPGKSDCLVLDHAGNVMRHGLATDERFWTLHGKYAQDEAKVKAAKEKKERAGTMEIVCPECKYVFTAQAQCPQCGYFFPPKAKRIETLNGKLVAIENAKMTQLKLETPDDKRRFHAMLVGHGKMHGYKPGWASFKYKEKFGEWPRGATPEPITPDVAVSRWIRSRQIAWRRAQERAAIRSTSADQSSASG
jgi:superfamily II DNA or RNA helicase